MKMKISTKYIKVNATEVQKYSYLFKSKSPCDLNTSHSFALLLGSLNDTGLQLAIIGIYAILNMKLTPIRASILRFVSLEFVSRSFIKYSVFMVEPLSSLPSSSC